VRPHLYPPPLHDALPISIEEYGAGTNNHRKNRLDQIVGNWGRFDDMSMQPAGTKGTVDFRFRNGNKVSFEAHAIKVEKLLDDVRSEEHTSELQSPDHLVC